jgi:hypothetical protein
MNGEIREGKQFHTRQNALTDSDIAVLTQIFNSVIDAKMHNNPHICRLQVIELGDLKAMVDAHKKFSAAMDDSKTIIRRYILIFVLTGMSGLTLYGYWAKVKDAMKSILLGQ